VAIECLQAVERRNGIDKKGSEEDVIVEFILHFLPCCQPFRRPTKEEAFQPASRAQKGAFDVSNDIIAFHKHLSPSAHIHAHQLANVYSLSLSLSLSLRISPSPTPRSRLLAFLTLVLSPLADCYLLNDHGQTHAHADKTAM